MSDEQPDRGRLGSEATLRGRARDSRTCGESVAAINPGDGTCNLTEVRAHRVPSSRAVRDPFPTLHPTGVESLARKHISNSHGLRLMNPKFGQMTIKGAD